MRKTFLWIVIATVFAALGSATAVFEDGSVMPIEERGVLFLMVLALFGFGVYLFLLAKHGTRGR